MSSWVCVARYGGVGDNLIASAVLPALKARYDHVEVLTQRPQHVVFENNPYIDKLSVHDSGDIPGEPDDAWQRWHKSRAKEYDGFFHLSHSVETLTSLTKLQTAFYWSHEMRRKLCGRSYLEVAADICGVPYDQLAPGFFPTSAEVEQAQATKIKYVGERAIGWVLCGTRIDKTYPDGAAAIARLIREVGPVVVLGAPTPKELAMAKVVEDHVEQMNGSKVGLAIALSPSFDNEVWPIRRVLTMAQCCDLVVGPDTGPMWAVASCDMPKVMLLSHASPENITKYWRNTVTLHADPARVPCWPCHKLIDVPEHCTPNRENTGAACISDISVERVVSAVKTLWEQKHASTRLGATPPGVHAAGGGARQRGRRGLNGAGAASDFGRTSQPTDQPPA